MLVGLLTACGGNSGVPKNLVGKAIALQVGQTQQQLSQQLKLSLPKSALNIDRVNIATQTPVTIQDLPSYKVTGTYDFTLKLKTREATQSDNPFEVYVQRQREGKTWRLAQQQTNENGTGWVTWLIE
ncbi:hypothetical protein GS601_17805 [Myxacorys almedinensis A]|uniref:Uncharacterized protein n=2 Tax=Myxacorys TaxID=2056239 RepID=A0A8J7Z3L5_9CYAN|nr:hypothetical protein [Myxacorys almedinensis]NDJ19119.1 hypothetical protein [Myxacorys almedinensis A]